MSATAYSYIRFSTAEQQKGDSLRRQLESSQKYASEHGLVLDEQLNMRDLGVSAFRGANIERGNLGVFIQAIEKGLVAPGSYLLVESLDRLSRAQVLDALEVFLTILRHEIIIVTLLDNRVYSRESVQGNYSEIIISIAVMARAHEESLTKSKRRRESWAEAKRRAIETGKKITRKVPFWLSLPDINGPFVVNQEASAVVARIFTLAKAGFGYWKICQTLNSEGVKSPGALNYAKKSGRTWGTSSVAHVLTVDK